MAGNILEPFSLERFLKLYDEFKNFITVLGRFQPIDQNVLFGSYFSSSDLKTQILLARFNLESARAKNPRRARSPLVSDFVYDFKEAKQNYDLIVNGSRLLLDLDGLHEIDFTSELNFLRMQALNFSGLTQRAAEHYKLGSENSGHCYTYASLANIWLSVLNSAEGNLEIALDLLQFATYKRSLVSFHRLENEVYVNLLRGNYRRCNRIIQERQLRNVANPSKSGRPIVLEKICKNLNEGHFKDALDELDTSLSRLKQDDIDPFVRNALRKRLKVV